MEYSPRLRDSLRLARRRRHGRARARSCGVEVVSSGDLVQRFSAVWDDGGDRDASARVREALPRQGSRVRSRRAAPRDGVADDGVRHPAADGRLVSRRRARQRLRPERVGGRRTPATRTTCRPRARHRAIRPDEIVLLDLWGKLDRPGAVFADITWMGFTGRAGARAIRAGVRGRRGGARRGDRAGAGRVARRPRAARLGGRPRRVGRAARRRLRRRRSCTAPATASASRCTATA